MTKNAMLMDAVTLHAFFKRALAVFDSTWGSEDDDQDPEKERLQSLTRRAAMDALAFAASQAAALQDPSLIGQIEEAVDAIADWNDDPRSIMASLGKAAGVLAGVESTPSKSTERLVRSTQDEVRYGMASGMRPVSPGAIELLRLLAKDPERYIRGPAVQSLGPDNAPPWWEGWFSADPAGRMTADQMTAAAPVLAKLKEMADKQWWTVGREEESAFPDLVGALPDPLATELGVAVLKREIRGDKAAPRVLAAVLMRPGAEAALETVVRHRAARHFAEVHYFESVLAEAVPNVPTARRAEVALHFARKAAGASVQQRRDSGSMARAWGLVFEKLWPREADPTAVLELALAADGAADGDRHEMDWALGPIGSAIASSAVDPVALLPRVVDAKLAGTPGAWKHLWAAVNAWVAAAPRDVRRDAALRALRSEDDAVLTWGLTELTGDLRDPDEDASPLAAIERHFAVPERRAVMLRDHTLSARSLVPLRRALREGASGKAGATAMRVIDSLWGGLASGFDEVVHGSRRDKDLGEHRAKERAGHAPWLGDVSMQGPASEEEWRLWREARSGLLQGAEPEWRVVLRLLPDTPGTWHPDDLRLIELAFRALESHPKPPDPMILAMALAGNPIRDHLPLWEVLNRACSDAADRRYVRNGLRAFQQALGITPDPAPRKSGGEEDDGWDE